MIKQILRRAALLYPFFFLVSFLGLYIFYTYFSISIQVWIGFQEILLLLVDDGVDFILYGFFLMMSTALIFWIQDIEVNFSGKRRFWFNVIRGTSMLAAASLMIYLSFATEKEVWAGAFNVCLYFLVAIPIIKILHRRHIDPKWLASYSRLDILTIVLLAALVINSVLKPMKKAIQYHKAPYSTVLLRDSTVVDSVVYLGKTEKYYMFYSREKDAPRIIDEETVKKVLLPGGFEVLY